MKKYQKVEYSIKVLSYDYNLLESQILSILLEIKLKFNFFKPKIIYSIPPSSKKLCILRSVFVDNSSKEHLEIKSYKSLIKIEIITKRDYIKMIDILILDLLKYPDPNITYKKNIKTFNVLNSKYF